MHKSQFGCICDIRYFQEKEGVFLLDDSRISEIHLASGRSRKKNPKLQPLLQKVLTMSASQNGKRDVWWVSSAAAAWSRGGLTMLFAGVWLGGVLLSGEVFLWNKDKDSLKTVSAVPELQQLLSSIKGLSFYLHLCIYQTLLSKATDSIQAIHVCSLGIEPTTFVLLTQCSTTEPQEHYF